MLRITSSPTALALLVVVILFGDQSEADDLNFLGISVIAQKGSFLVTKKPMFVQVQ